MVYLRKIVKRHIRQSVEHIWCIKGGKGREDEARLKYVTCNCLSGVVACLEHGGMVLECQARRLGNGRWRHSREGLFKWT